MTVTTEDLKKIGEGFNYNNAAAIRSAQEQLQRIIQHIEAGGTLTIEDINLNLNTIQAFRDFVRRHNYIHDGDFNVPVVKQTQERAQKEVSKSQPTKKLSRVDNIIVAVAMTGLFVLAALRYDSLVDPETLPVGKGKIVIAILVMLDNAGGKITVLTIVGGLTLYFFYRAFKRS